MHQNAVATLKGCGKNEAGYYLSLTNKVTWHFIIYAIHTESWVNNQDNTVPC